jgi:hypothetical protein
MMFSLAVWQGSIQLEEFSLPSYPIYLKPEIEEMLMFEISNLKSRFSLLSAHKFYIVKCPDFIDPFYMAKFKQQEDSSSRLLLNPHLLSSRLNPATRVAGSKTMH